MPRRINENSTHVGQVERFRFLSTPRAAQLKTALKTEIRRLQELQITHDRSVSPISSQLTGVSKLSQSNIRITPDAASKKISQFWRNYKIKKKMIADPYGFYLSLVDPNDELRMISAIMYGKYVAAIRSSEFINNPFLSKHAFYHRDDNLTGVLIEDLYSKYKITPKERREYQYIPVVLLESLKISDNDSIKLLKKKGESIGFLKIHKNYPENKYKSLLNEIRALGLIASGWDIAQSYRGTESSVAMTPQAEFRSDLSSTKVELLNSPQMKILRKVAISVKYPTRFLARSLAKMLDTIPETMNQEAIGRIMLILDMANTFYTMNYSRFSFCVYSIIHEISLELIRIQKSNQTDYAEKNYQAFLQESESTLLNSLGIDKSNLKNSTFFASPAYSGTNAYGIVQQLLKKMIVSNHPPKVHFFEPCYYEFNYVKTARTKNPDDADIFCISAGPIVNKSGLLPGIDINKLVKEKVIDCNRIKPLTIVVDATTALYRHLRLSPEVSELVKSGKLSIIIFESHQKFGLLHSDQSQYGRVMGICANLNFHPESVRTQQELGKLDFLNHIDLQVGAYINTKCRETLEQIKEQHFTNGASLRNVLCETKLIQESNRQNHHLSLEDTHQDYFVTAPTDSDVGHVLKKIDNRDSFGHYNVSRSVVGNLIRISSGASDYVDQLLEAGKLYFYSFHPYDLLHDFLKSADNIVANEIDKIILLSALNCIVHQLKKGKLSFSQIENLTKFIEKMSETLKICHSLNGREAFQIIQKLYFQLLKEKHALTKASHTAAKAMVWKTSNFKEMRETFMTKISQGQYPTFKEQKTDLNMAFVKDYLEESGNPVYFEINKDAMTPKTFKVYIFQLVSDKSYPTFECLSTLKFEGHEFEKSKREYFKTAVYSLLKDVLNSPHYDVIKSSTASKNITEYVTQNISAVEKVYLDVGTDLQFCNNEHDALTLLKAKYNGFRLSSIPDYTQNKELLLLKSRLEYQEKLYEIRIRNKFEYTGLNVSWFRRARSSATEKYQATLKMIQAIDSLISGENENINFEFGIATEEGKLHQLYVELKEHVERLHNQTPKLMS